MKKNVKKNLTMWGSALYLLWVTGSLEGLVMFAQDCWQSGLLLLGLPLAIHLLCMRFEEKFSPLVRRCFISAGFLLWPVLVIVRDFQPNPRILWQAFGGLCWFITFYYISFLEKQGVEQSGDHESFTNVA